MWRIRQAPCTSAADRILPQPPKGLARDGAARDPFAAAPDQPAKASPRALAPSMASQPSPPA